MPTTDNNQTKKSLSVVTPPDDRVDNFEDLIPASAGDEGLVTGEVRPVLSSTEAFFSGRGVFNTTEKNPARGKSNRTAVSGPPDVQLDAKQREAAISAGITEDQLISRIKSMPDKMLPKYIRDNADVIVKSFKINTREKVAIFFGQIASESLRGSAEYVYYSKNGILSVSKKFSNYISGDENRFSYSDDSTSPYGVEVPPWTKNGFFDSYYGGRINPRNELGNKFNRTSQASGGPKNIGTNVPRDKSILNPGHYDGSPDGYAYRGHGSIQITGKHQYQVMNQYFGKDGKFLKTGIDFVKEPWRVAEEKYAILSALMWWENNRGVSSRNEVSRSTVKDVTKAVSNSYDTYEQRYIITERYYKYLLGGTIVVSDQEPEWMRIAKEEIGVKGISGVGSNIEVEKYHKAAGGASSDDVPWCSSFANWVMQESGYSGTNSKAARSWLSWTEGSESEPRYGAVTILWRGSPSGTNGHVGFLQEWDDKYVYLIGGNQSNSVKVSRYERSRVLGFRWPNDIP